MSREIEQKIRQFIEKHQLIQSGDELVLGVSGGADSMMLFHYLYTHKSLYHITLKVAHIQHGIRMEAEEDAKLVEAVCKERNVPFFRHDCNIKEIAKEKQLSEEEAGREERYNFFISLLNPNGKIVTAHNMNDQAETLMMRFFRGTDIKGLGGIPPKRNQIIRPLLGLTRAEIEAYCEHYELAYRDDHTNFLPVYTRNKIRLQAIPYVQQEINPSIVRVLGEHSHLYREEEDFLRAHTTSLFEACAKAQGETITIAYEQLSRYHVYMQKRILLLAIEQLANGVKDITSKHLESCLSLVEGQSGKSICLPDRLIFKKEFNQLILMKQKEERSGYSYPLKIGTQRIKEAGIEVSLSLVEGERIEQKDEKIYTKYIDYGKMKNEFYLRTRLPYDYIVTGNGTKKLKKLLIDDKVPKTLRDKIPLIADGDEIVWVVGSRLSTNYYITPETAKILQIKITAYSDK